MRCNRREMIFLMMNAGAGFALAAPEEPAPPLIPAPDNPADWDRFREDLVHWRVDVRRQIGYRGSLYSRKEFAWVPRCYCCCFLMLYDQAIYDPRGRRWRVEELLAEHTRRFGGLDAVVLWHAYPRIGLDDRNQFDFYRDMPGGLEGLRGVVDRFHRQDVRVFLDYNPWDTSTRREGCSDIEALARMVRALDADGIFLDTLNEGAGRLRASLDAVKPGVALESEGALPVERIEDHPMSWAQGFGDSRAPGVLRNKWLERRHMQHRIDRWQRDHSGELQSAFMNGSGILVWENVFGSWVGWNARDRWMLRAILPILRRYAPLFAGEKWTPLVPTLHPHVYASRWEGEGKTLYTLVNRAGTAAEGPLLQADASSRARWFDLIAGKEIRPAEARSGRVIEGRIDARSVGALLAAETGRLGAGFASFLASQARNASLRSEDTAFPIRPIRLAPARASAHPPAYSLPGNMVRIPGGSVRLVREMRARECGFCTESEPSPGMDGGPALHATVRFHRTAGLKPYAMDLTPVTNRAFHAFLTAARYHPRDARNFLRHWVNGKPAPGTEDHPVVWVDLEDARAYARWAGKRLPTEDEWQYAAQGPGGLLYPWGDSMEPGRCNDGASPGTTPVFAFPNGRSPFGCWDLCGNVWEWTESERTDGRTRFALLKGGCWYRAQGSDWYFDGGPRSNRFAAKMLLLWPGLDRCATVGFRCAADLV